MPVRRLCCSCCPTQNSCLQFKWMLLLSQTSARMSEKQDVVLRGAPFCAAAGRRPACGPAAATAAAPGRQADRHSVSCNSEGTSHRQAALANCSHTLAHSHLRRVRTREKDLYYHSHSHHRQSHTLAKVSNRIYLRLITTPQQSTSID